MQQTQLLENFSLGITSPLFNPVCLGPGGVATGVTRTSRTRASAASSIPLYVANPSLLPGLMPYDLTRGGSYFLFHGAGNIDQFAFYATDDIKLGNFSVNVGFRFDQYNGLVSEEWRRNRGWAFPIW